MQESRVPFASSHCTSKYIMTTMMTIKTITQERARSILGNYLVASF